MAAEFPGTVPTIATNKVDATVSATDHPAHHNKLGEEVVAIATELGTNPSGAAATVGARFSVIENAPLNPKNAAFGAVFDGSTDDTAAWQACLDAVPASGGEVYMPPGTSIVSGIKVKSKTKIRGAGIGNSILKLKNSAAQLGGTDWPYAAHRAIMINQGAAGAGATDITIEGIEFDGNVANNVAVEQTYCLAFSGVRRLFVHDCYFRDVRAEGVALLVNAPGVIVENEDCHIENCILFNCGFINGGPGNLRQGIAVISGVRIVVRGISAKTIGAYVVDFESDSSTEQHRNCIVSDIVGEDVGGGVGFISWTAGQSTDNLVSNVTLKDGPSGPLSFGVVAQKQQRMIIRGVLSDYVYNSGPVICELSDDVSIFDVISFGSNNGGSGPAINLLSCNRIFVQGCTLRDSGGGQTYAVKETTATGPTTVNGNHILEGTLGPVLFTHSSSRLIDPQSGGGLKLPVRAASTGNINVSSPGATIDGVTLSAGPPQDRVLLKDQTTASQNGIYIWNGAAVAMARSIDANTSAKLTESLLVTVDEGAMNADTVWSLSTPKPVTLGTTSLRFGRLMPGYNFATRDPWSHGGNAIAATMDRNDVTNLVAQTAITAICSFHGGMVVPAGRLITNINAFCTAAGAGAVTTFWWALVRQSDRVVLQRTANSTTLPTVDIVHTRALQAAITLDYDTPCYIALGTQVATTSPSFAGVTGLATSNFSAPILTGNSSTSPTSTPPTVGAVLGAPAAGNTGRIHAWLS